MGEFDTIHEEDDSPSSPSATTVSMRCNSTYEIGRGANSQRYHLTTVPKYHSLSSLERPWLGPGQILSKDLKMEDKRSRRGKLGLIPSCMRSAQHGSGDPLWPSD